jgi:hypothetical protein
MIRFRLQPAARYVGLNKYCVKKYSFDKRIVDNKINVFFMMQGKNYFYAYF